MTDTKLLLRVAIKLMSLVAVGFLLYVFLIGLFVREETTTAGFVIDISKIRPGQFEIVDTGERKILLLHRTQQQLDELKTVRSELYDADSTGNQPAGVDSLYRSVKPAFLVVYAYDPFFGCDIKPDQSSNRIVSICANVKYDMAGRIYKGSVSQSNLIVPHYQYIDDDTIVIKE